MNYYSEKYYPFVTSVIIGVLFYLNQTKILRIDETINKLLESALSICGALLGFLLTILTIINSIETRRMRFVKESGKFPLLNHYLKFALIWNLICISISFLLPILFSIQAVLASKHEIYTLIVFVVAITWISNIRFAIIFIKLLTDPNSENK